MYGEDDDVVNSSFSYLWENADLWRKYQLKGAKNQTEAIDKIEDFSHLERFLHFLNHASNDEFKENYPKYIDFDKTVRWAVHNAIMDSYHQGNNRNARILYNTVTKKFEPIPWDNLPDMYGRIGTYQREAFMNHILLARFYNVVEFQRAYSELLYQTASKILAKASEIFHELYLSKSVRCAELENDFFVPRFDAPKLTGSQLFSYNGLKRMLFEPTWPETVQAMENATRSRLETLLAEFRNAHAFVYQSRTVSPETERSDAHLKLRYASRRASTLKRISISVKNKLANDKPIPVTVTFKTVPASSVYQVYLHDEELAARSDSKSVIGTVEGQNVVFDNLDFTLSPDFPEKSARFAAGAQEWSPVGYGAFDIFIDILDPDIWIIPGSTRVEVIASDKNPLNIKYRWADK